MIPLAAGTSVSSLASNLCQPTMGCEGGGGRGSGTIWGGGVLRGWGCGLLSTVRIFASL